MQTPDADLSARAEAAWPAHLWRDLHVVVTVSGGSDSVALLTALHAVKQANPGRGRLIVAHFDHRTRPESAEDAAWVAELAGRLGLEVEAGVSDESGPRSEEQLRNDRHTFFADVVARTGARYLATGHTADDQAETVLFRVFRGAGLEGLGGVAASRPLGHAATIVRPLLGVRRQEAIDYLASVGQSYRTDPSNVSLEPTRNWIRHELLPLVEERFGPGVRDAVVRLAEQSAESQAVVARLAAEALDRAALPAEGNDQAIALRAAELIALEPAVATEAIRLAWRRAGLPERAMTARHWRSILAVAAGETPTANLPGSYEARRTGDVLRITAQR